MQLRPATPHTPITRVKKANRPTKIVGLCRLKRCGVQTSFTFSALGPFGPRPSLNDTRCPSWSSSYRTPSRSDEWKKMSLSPPVLMNPKPLSVSRLIVPSAILPNSPKKCLCSVAQNQHVQAAPPQRHNCNGYRMQNLPGADFPSVSWQFPALDHMTMWILSRRNPNTAGRAVCRSRSLGLLDNDGMGRIRQVYTVANTTQSPD